MFGWWSEEYLIKNSHIPIYIYTTEFGLNAMVLVITETMSLPPDNIYKWNYVGEIYNHVNTINFNNLLVANDKAKAIDINTDIDKGDDDESLPRKKRQKLSQNEISLISEISYGWYSEEFVNRKNNFICDRNKNSVPEPKVHKYLTPLNSTVLVTHVSSNPNDKPLFSDTIFVGEVTKYLETISYY